MIYLIDNYDSFSYNLYQLVGALDPNIVVVRNDEITIDELKTAKPDAIILSPGPGRPADAGICEAVAVEIADVPILGVCLGHQAICETFGGTITYAKQLMHGKQSEVEVDPTCPLFEGMSRTAVARYHSLAVDSETLPSCLKVVAKTDDGEVMAVAHEARPIFGVQFHPESILTPQGKDMLANFFAFAKARAGQ